MCDVIAGDQDEYDGLLCLLEKHVPRLFVFSRMLKTFHEGNAREDPIGPPSMYMLLLRSLSMLWKGRPSRAITHSFFRTRS